MVDFNLTKDQQKFIELAREFADQEIRPVETRLDKLEDPNAPFESEEFRAVVRKAYEIGFHKINFPTFVGGLGLDMFTTMLVFEELVRGGAGIASTIFIAGSVALLSMGTANAKLIDKYTRPFCEDNEGKVIGALPIVEPNVGSDAFDLENKDLRFATTAVPDGDEYVINGGKAAFVSNGGLATHYLATVQVYPEHGMGGAAGVIIPADLPGVSRGRALDKVGMRCLNQSEVFFDDVRVPKDHIVMEPDPATARFQMESCLNMANTTVAFTALGVMRAAYEEAVAYAKERVQGGKPIIEHANIKLKLFDARATIEASKAILAKAAWTNANRFPADIVLSISGRWFVCNQAMRVTQEMVQVMGGYGISKEYPVEKFMRDAKMTMIEDGALDTVALFAAYHL